MEIRLHKILLAVAALCASAACGDMASVRRAGDIRLVSPRDAEAPGTAFAFEATIVHPDETSSRSRRAIFVSDESGHAVLQNYIAGTNFMFRAGDRVRAAGVVIGERGGIYAHCTNMALVARGEPPNAVRTTIGALFDLGAKNVVLKGIDHNDGRIRNFVANREAGPDAMTECVHEKLPFMCHGTGDAFASAMIGGVMAGLDLAASARLAGEFVHNAMAQTRFQPHYEERGVSFELLIGKVAALLQR